MTQALTDWGLNFDLFIFNSITSVHLIASYFNILLRFEVFTSVKTSMLIFWIVTPCGLVGIYQCFKGTCCLHLHPCCSETLVSMNNSTQRRGSRSIVIRINIVQQESSATIYSYIRAVDSKNPVFGGHSLLYIELNLISN